MLNNKKTIVAVTGSVAAHRSLDLIRELKKNNAIPRVILTPAATRFVTPLSLQIASGNAVISDLFSHPMAHVELPKWGDVMIVAPVTANTIAKFFAASASDVVSACFLSFQGPVVVAPAMNWRMYTDPIFQDRLLYLRNKGVVEVAPEKGHLACGEEGLGRMASVEKIISETARVLTKKNMLNKKVLVTAGPTREYIDPVRFISNRSSGKMGYAIARNAYIRGADVMLISGPSSLVPPEGVTTEFVETTQQMKEAVTQNIKDRDVLIMAAAVADYSPSKKENSKIVKRGGLSLDLHPTEEIIGSVSSLAKRPLIVGFSAETGSNLERAREKMYEKGMDMIVFNNVSLNGSGFDVDTNEVTLMDRNTEKAYPLMSKERVALTILDKIVEMLT